MTKDFKQAQLTINEILIKKIYFFYIHIHLFLLNDLDSAL